jgi:hypothetical protein
MLRLGCRPQMSPRALLALAVLAICCAPVAIAVGSEVASVDPWTFATVMPPGEMVPEIINGERPAPVIETTKVAMHDTLLTPAETAPAIGNAPAVESQWSLDPAAERLSPSDCPPDSWSWQWAPTGLIYHSYLAGPHEPRMALVAFYDGEERAFWDATLGARVGLVRYGDCNSMQPQGYQLDFYGAAISRLDVEHRQDLVATDYVFGFPLTYGVDDWQFKFGYAHVSSHLGDEHAIRYAGALDDRINYVRDGVVLGVSRYLYPFWRQYAEIGWAFHTSGGAEPLELQFGSEFSTPGPTSSRFVPFLAVHGHLREEQSFGGDFALQTGWLRRGDYGQTLRFGFHFYTGKSSQMQFFEESEEQLGLGIWYDL